MKEDVGDLKKENNKNSQKSFKSIVDLLIKASAFLFIGVLFIFKDSIHTASQGSKYFYAASLIFFSFSTLIGFYNLLTIARAEYKTTLYEEENRNSDYRKKDFRFILFRKMNMGLLLQFSFFTYGLLSTIILALKGLCPLWPIC